MTGGLRRVLFVCTGNSARSQIAEALLSTRGAGRYLAGSAGSEPAARVNPLALQTLRDAGVDWTAHPPQGIDTVFNQPWDFVITVCDHARESCPVFPGQPVAAHWGLPDPAAVEGTEEQRERAFREAFVTIARRIDLFLALPMEKLDRLALERRVREIGGVGG